MAAKEGTFAAHLFGRVGRPRNTGTEMRALLTGEGFATLRGEAALGIFLGLSPFWLGSPCGGSSVF
ncbi:MAG: hypothetical protein JST28_16355 [Acidobacteria bacterium]|nr:hypothetical protein [Acidobacteriota bacterium]